MEKLLLVPFFILGMYLALLVSQALLSYIGMALAEAYDTFTVVSQDIRERAGQAAWKLDQKARSREFLKLGAGVTLLGAAPTRGGGNPGGDSALRENPPPCGARGGSCVHPGGGL